MTKRPAYQRAVAILIAVVALVLVDSTAGAAPKPKPPPSPSPGDSTPPTTPTNLRVTGTTRTSVSLAWDPSTDNSGTFSYVVKLDNSLSLTVPQTQTSYTPDWLSPGRTYSFFVYAVDKALNTSGNSNTVTATTQPDLTPPSAPVLSVPDVSPSQVWLSWTESTDDLRFNVVGYTVFVDGQVATGVNWINHTDASLRHLAPSSTHTFMVQARDGSGNVANSNVVSVTTQASSDTVPPSAPTNLRIESEQGCAEVWLAWDQATDDVDPQSMIEYEVYVNGELSPLAVETGVGRSFQYGTVNGLNSFVVKAVDRSGNTSAASNTASGELWLC